MGLEKILKKFDLFGIQTHPISLNPHGLRANRTSPNWELEASGTCFDEIILYPIEPPGCRIGRYYLYKL
jgi:hypothetical protein